MLRFRNSKSNYKDTPSNTLLSVEYTHTEKVINGTTHLIGDKKTIDLCSEEFAKNHFPNPKDYTLENLIKSGANLQETSVEIENDNDTLEDAVKLNNMITKQNKEE